ncbi:MAG: bifunctional UDP-3-O-[3-hydroxymyristoyl] N-acetylglucosamine deacetylase/3-hydroxyacyl-ACP dehydratase [Candidatus Krumholzibacteriota bacterium]|nr:bifunctional UDP-3-O-[3-hydroxymyristoyl] N-acetylglucosamine deacetylase/3-hydroxyacyl-ACP dehydratase [Candidatus Krumholzibacteriota bacterium]
MIRQQQTLAREFTYEGIGLHTGNPVTMRFLPAPANTGVRFRRIDQSPPVELAARIENTPHVDVALRNTTLARDSVSIHTVEHVLATLNGLGVDNCIIDIDSNEPAEPHGGSCDDYVTHIKEAGIVAQGAPVRYFEVTQPICLVEDTVELLALPYDGFRISFTINYDHPHLGTQYASFDITPRIFEEEIAGARTFVLLDDVERLREQGLIKGGNVENAIVVGPEGILNNTPLRYSNEFVRHKILDLLGDLSLVGRPIKGHIISHRSGHVTNVRFARLLTEAADQQAAAFSGGDPSGWNIRDIQRIMPHRYPFLLVDRLVEMEDGKRVVGVKNVTINEPFFQGHFPGHPIFPAVLILEAMAQTGGVLLLSTVDKPEGKLVYFLGIDNARFRRPVMPGDQLRFELTMLRLKKRGCKMRGEAFVDGQLVAEAELLAQVVDR